MISDAEEKVDDLNKLIRRSSFIPELDKISQIGYKFGQNECQAPLRTVNALLRREISELKQYSAGCDGCIILIESWNPQTEASLTFSKMFRRLQRLKGAQMCIEGTVKAIELYVVYSSGTVC